jgi:hypothetical protein
MSKKDSDEMKNDTVSSRSDIDYDNEFFLLINKSYFFI